MSQATLDDDDLFDEAAAEMREDVETSLAAAKSSLPAPDDVWEAEADNTLGVLNGLKGALDAGDAEEDLRDAKKWFAIGRKADAFEDAEDLEAEIEALETTLSRIADAHEQVGKLTATVPELRGALEDAESGDGTE
ncbi:uncharacterized protein Nmlp_3765 [Natronomonas moolapensis 8.8.11]|uniref:Uncharacterized protein n=1 Tax=Natronomonas moolapensis (strain DSM 18674 / CECT 7526 / JCM 14361 / 8.8.11) TaxID=268739 RepID=M1XLK4_NATM8|nr:DUF5790 family protein [Natronomonas moolapensis]CCQ37878.1 uncharacterized protein Nmlp_3765 [Natronomonas moolapensis 8.8.11]